MDTITTIFNYKQKYEDICVELEKMVKTNSKIENKQIAQILSIEPYYTIQLFDYAIQYNNLELIKQVLFQNEMSIKILFQIQEIIREIPSFVLPYNEKFYHPLLLCLIQNADIAIFESILNFMHHKKLKKNIYVKSYYSTEIRIEPVFFFIFDIYHDIGKYYKSNISYVIQKLMEYGYDINEKRPVKDLIYSDHKDTYLAENEFDMEVIKIIIPFMSFQHYCNSLKFCLKRIDECKNEVIGYLQNRINNFTIFDLENVDFDKSYVINFQSAFNILFNNLKYSSTVRRGDFNIRNWFFKLFVPLLQEDEKTWLFTKVIYDNQTLIERFPNECKNYILDYLFQNSFRSHEKIVSNNSKEEKRIVNKDCQWFSQIIQIDIENQIKKEITVVLLNYLSWFPNEMMNLLKSFLD